MKYTYSGSDLAKPERVSSHVAPSGKGRRQGGMLKWIITLVALCGAAWIAYKPAMRWFGKDSSSVPAPPSASDSTNNDSTNNVRDAEVKVSVEQIKAYLTPSEAEMVQLYNYIVTAPFVAENLQYRKRLGDLPFIYLATNDVVNAVSLRRVVEKDGKKNLVFHTVFLGGAARYARLVGLAAALQDAGHKDMLSKFVSSMPRRFCARCTEEECVSFIVENGLAAAVADEKIRQRALSYSSGTIVSVLAHECGHHALGHLLAFREKVNLEIDRNEEREADSFASSVISASPFGEYIFAGTLFWHYAMAMQADDDSDSASDHPLSRERFENFVRANADKAAAMGITLKK